MPLEKEMKKALLISISLTVGLIEADHLALHGSERLDFAEKRLTMIEKKLEIRKSEQIGRAHV